MPIPDEPDSSIRDPGHLDAAMLEALRIIPIAIWITDRCGHLRWMNIAATSLFGPRIGACFSGLVAYDDAATAREMYAGKVQGRLDSTVQRLLLKTPRGSVQAELTSVPLRERDDVFAVFTLIRLEESEQARPRRRPMPRLTPRQKEVLELLAQGRTTEEMARTLQVTETTVRNHIRHLLAELRVHSRLEAIAVAFRNGWL
jgi:DNA-binding NarL/FixJ family response regulator